MDAASALPSLTLAAIAVVAVLSGPVGPLDLTAADDCDEAIFPGEGNATVAVTDLPDRATLSESEFGAEVWRLDVPAATVNVSDVVGRPTVSYRLSIRDLGRTVGTTTVLSRCSTGMVRVAIDRSTFEPDRIENENYDGTLYVVYRGSENGTDVERTLVERNVTVEVVE